MESNYLYDENNTQKTSQNVKRIVFVLFALFLISFSKYLPYEHTANTNTFWGQIYNLYFFIFNQTLGIVHEGGHGVCYLFHCPQFMTALNGTLFQLFFPLGISYYYRRKKQYFASYIALFFVGFSLLYTAWYVSTSYQGATVSAANSFLGVDGYHDFYYILNSMGLLNYYSPIAGFTKFLSYLIMIVSVGMMFFDSIKSNTKKRYKRRRRYKKDELNKKIFLRF